MKKLLFISIICSFILVLHGQVTNGLIAYYPFNGNADDQSGNGHNGIVHNADLTTDRFGVTNGAYSFNGINAIIEIPDHIDFHMSNFTICAWLNVNQSAQSFVSKAYGNSYFNSFDMAYENFLEGVFTDGVSQTIYLSATALPGTWIHCAMIFDDVNNELKFYTNGTLASTIATSFTIAYDNSIVTIGGEYNNGILAYLTSGSVDEVRIYNRILTEAEIDSLANPLPFASIANKTIVEGNSGTSIMKFKVTLDHANSSVVKLNYKTLNGTAKAGSDYVAATGTLKFQPGQTSKNVSITINGDIINETNERFKVVLSNPRKTILLDSSGVGTIDNDDKVFISSSGLKTSDALKKSGFNFSVYPNPAKETASLLINGNFNSLTVTLTNLSGKVLWRKENVTTSSGITLPVQNLTNGTYLVIVADGAKKETLRLIKAGN